MGEVPPPLTRAARSRRIAWSAGSAPEGCTSSPTSGAQPISDAFVTPGDTATGVLLPPGRGGLRGLLDGAAPARGGPGADVPRRLPVPLLGVGGDARALRRAGQAAARHRADRSGPVRGRAGLQRRHHARRPSPTRASGTSASSPPAAWPTWRRPGAYGCARTSSRPASPPRSAPPTGPPTSSTRPTRCATSPTWTPSCAGWTRCCAPAACSSSRTPTSATSWSGPPSTRSTTSTSTSSRATSVRAMAERHGFELVDVERLPVHGGEVRYTLARRGARDAERGRRRAAGGGAGRAAGRAGDAARVRRAASQHPRRPGGAARAAARRRARGSSATAPPPRAPP